PPVPSSHRHLLQPHQGGPVRHRGDAHPLLLRLQRHRRSGRGRGGVGTGHPSVDRDHRRSELRPVGPVLGSARHRADRRMITKAPPRPKAPPPAPKPAASARRRPLPSAAKGLLAVIVAAVALLFGIKGAYGGFGHYYTVSLDLPRAGQPLETGSDV